MFIVNFDLLTVRIKCSVFNLCNVLVYDQFNPRKEGKCSWCNEKDSIEEIDKDDLENLGIRLPSI